MMKWAPCPFHSWRNEGWDYPDAGQPHSLQMNSFLVSRRDPVLTYGCRELVLPMTVCSSALLLALCLAPSPPSAGYLHSGDVFAWEGIGGVADEETGFTHSSGRDRKHTQDLLL